MYQIGLLRLAGIKTEFWACCYSRKILIFAILEKLINTNALSKSQLETVQSINAAVDRLARMNKGLVLVTKVENNQFTDVRELHLAGFIRDILESYRELLGFKNLHFKTDLENSGSIKMSMT